MTFNELTEQIKDLYRDGYTISEIALEVDYGETLVKHCLDDIFIEERDAELVALRKEDPDRWTYKALSEKFEISRTRVYEILCEAGLVTKQGGPKTTNRDRFEIKVRYAEGEDAGELAEEFGVSKSYIYKLGSQSAGKKDRLSDRQKEEIARRCVINKEVPRHVAADMGVGGSTAYLYRFPDPLKQPDFYSRHRYKLKNVREDWDFDDPENNIEDYHKAYRLYHEEGMSQAKIREETDLTDKLIRSARKISTTDAYRAVWEYAAKTGRLPCQ